MKWYPIEDFHKMGFKPLFYIGSNGTIDSCEVYKYKGDIPSHITQYSPIEHKEVVGGKTYS